MVSQVIEYSPVAVNLVILIYYSFFNFMPGKFLYWLGALILNIGIVIMKG